MSLTLARTGHIQERRAPTRAAIARGPIIEIALVNNMPDSALRATERQFRAAVQAAADKMTVRMYLFTLPGIPRDAEALRYIGEHYGSLQDMLKRSFDAVIVTGNEPRADRLDREPYWRDLARVVEWAGRRTQTSLWSCLAAHAAVFHLHGIERHPLAAKLSGVFECAGDPGNPLLSGVAQRICVPHSRLNEIRRADLVAHGYNILTESPEIGVDVFSLETDSRFVFLQGHPEYETDSLLREYRRDVGRYLRGEIADYPAEPSNYFSAEAIAILHAFRRRAERHRDPRLFEVFPNVASPFAITNRWRDSTMQFYRNWLEGIVARKARYTALRN